MALPHNSSAALAMPFSAICFLQKSRFTSSKPSKSAIASDEKFIRLRTNSFVRYCLKWCGQRPPCAKRTFPRRAFPPLSTGPSLKTERFQRGRSCGTGGNHVRGAPARLHRHKQFVRGGSGGRHAAWKPCRPPAAFGSFPLRERNSHVRRRAKLPQAASSSYLCAYFSPT